MGNGTLSKLKGDGGMNKHQELIDAVIEQIKTDVRGKDMTAIEELLCALPVEKLIGFLPEEFCRPLP